MKGRVYMGAFIISALFGVGQMFLLRELLRAMNTCNKKRAFGIFSVKFVSYGIAIALLMFPYLHRFTFCLFGFITALPLTAIGLIIYKTFFKNED